MTEGRPDFDSWDDEQEAHGEALRGIVLGYLDDHDVDEGVAVYGLVELALSIAMSGYVLNADRPTGAGLRQTLDRLGKDIRDLVAEAEASADEFVAETVAALAVEGEA